AVAVSPISLAYSGVMLATAPVPRVARCQMPRNAANSTIETTAARKRREKVISLSPLAGRGALSAQLMSIDGPVPPHPDRKGDPTSPRKRGEVRRKRGLNSSRRLPDLEAVEIFLGLGRIERLAHHRKTLGRGRGRRQPGFLHHSRGVGGEIDLRSNTGIVDIALDLPPALHLGHDPDRKGLPRERIEIDAVRLRDDIAETVGESARENLLQHDLRLVEI